MSMLAWPLSGGARRLEAPVLIAGGDVRRIEGKLRMGGRKYGSDGPEILRLLARRQIWDVEVATGSNEGVWGNGTGGRDGTKKRGLTL